MKTYKELKREAELLLKQAEDARKRESKEVIQKVLNILSENGLTVEDLLPKNKRFKKANNVKRVIPAKYRGPNGETWTGRGQMPVWLASLVKQGHTKEQYLIK